jgi:hypothetical protein
MTMVEVMVSVIILTISVHLLSSTITATIGHTAGRRERAAAVIAASNMLEEMRGAPFRELFALYNQDPNDDPGGVGTAPGPAFAVPLLTVRDGDPDGFVGLVTFADSGPQVYENTQDPMLGLPRDLNGDILIDALDHAADHLLVPARIRLEWKGQIGERSFEMYTMFAELPKLNE